MEEEKRTTQQNKSLWLWFTLLAEKLNDSGLDMRKIFEGFKEGVNVPWDKQSVHDYLWMPFQKAVLLKDSTTKLKKKEDIDNVYDVFNKYFGEKYGFYQEFPSKERLMEEENNKK